MVLTKITIQKNKKSVYLKTYNEDSDLSNILQLITPQLHYRTLQYATQY